MEDIEVVIKIPEELYEIIKNPKKLETMYHASRVCQAICNGTPLPEGHGDLIDKGKFKKWIETQDGDRLMTEYYLDALDMQETIVGGSHDEDID